MAARPRARLREASTAPRLTRVARRRTMAAMTVAADLLTRPLTDADEHAVAQLARWAAQPNADKECTSLAARCSSRGAPSHEINYGIFVDGVFIGGIGTSGEYFNVMWIHPDHRGQGLAARAAFVVIARQLKEYRRAIVNSPNETMCRALRKIMTPARASRVRCGGSISTLTFNPGDLR